MVKKIIETCTDIVKEVAKDVYVDGLQPVTKQAGKALGTIGELANTVLLPVKIANAYLGYKASEFISDLENKTKDIPKEKLIEPSLRISGPILEGLKYTDTPELREMFLNLLASAMNVDTEANTHPSFVETIKQLSTLDAKIFSQMFSLKQANCVGLQLEKPETTTYYINAFPIFFVEELSLMADPFLISSSIQNLLRLGLINHYDVGLESYNYNKVQEHPYVKNRINLYEAKLNEKVKLTISKGSLFINDYGKNFAHVCL